MKIQEPINEECPQCKSQMQFTLKWILREDGVCPVCKGDLSTVREPIKEWIKKIGNEWRHMANSVDIAMKIEDRFAIEFDDREIFEEEERETETTLAYIIESTDKILKRNGKLRNTESAETEVLDIVRQEFPNEPYNITAETKIVDLGKIYSE